MSARRAIALLFLCLLGLYCLTSGGHTSSNDEDELFYVTQALADRGQTDIPADEAQILWADPGHRPAAADGKYYSAYESLPNLL